MSSEQAEKGGRKLAATLVNAVDKLLSLIDGVLATLLGLALLATTLLLLVNAAGRSMSAFQIAGGPTLAGLLIVWMTFIGIYLAVRQQRHIAVDLLTHIIPDRPRAALQQVVNVVGLLSCLRLTELSWQFAANRFASGQTDQMLFISSGYFYLPVPIGFGLCSLGFAFACLKTFADRGIKLAEKEN